jgi:hypothetical protein
VRSSFLLVLDLGVRAPRQAEGDELAVLVGRQLEDHALGAEASAAPTDAELPAQAPAPGVADRNHAAAGGRHRTLHRAHHESSM